MRFSCGPVPGDWKYEEDLHMIYELLSPGPNCIRSKGCNLKINIYSPVLMYRTIAEYIHTED